MQEKKKKKRVDVNMGGRRFIIYNSPRVRRVTMALRVSSWKSNNVNEIYGLNFQQNCQCATSLCFHRNCRSHLQHLPDVFRLFLSDLYLYCSRCLYIFLCHFWYLFILFSSLVFFLVQDRHTQIQSHKNDGENAHKYFHHKFLFLSCPLFTVSVT